VIRQNQERLCRSLGLSETLAALCFHACWVQHAADEVAEGTAMEPGPFLRIVERLAREPYPFSQAAGVDSADR
jgi:hypothetical protein